MYLLIKLRDIINYQFKKNFSMWVYWAGFVWETFHSKVQLFKGWKCYPTDKSLSSGYFFIKTYCTVAPNLFIGWHYLSFKQWGPETGNLALQSEGIEGKVSWFESRLMSC